MSEQNYWASMRRRRLSRRTLLGASARAGVGAAGLALVGCGDDDDDATVADTPTDEQQAQDQAEQTVDQTEPEDEPTDEPEPVDEEQQAVAGAITRGGMIRFTTPAATHDYFDPHRAVFGPTQSWMSLYMNYLIRWRNKEQNELEADIGSLPEIPDDETYIFSIDQGATFWDQFPTEGGRAVTAEDIRWNVQRNIDAVDADGADDGTFLQATQYRKTAVMDVIDEQTISMKTAGPDATYLTAVHAGPFSWITSPEAAETFGNRWRDETTNVDLSSGTGFMIPVEFTTDTGMFMDKNPNYWKPGEDGAPLPYYERVELHNFTDATAIEAAYRNRQVDVGAFPLSKLQVEGLQADFPEHKYAQRAFGFTIVNAFNYNPDWPGEDGNGNPWLDRRVGWAFNAAVDRFLQMDTVYLGDARVSSTASTPWFNQFWGIPDDELLTVPGWRPDRNADLQFTQDMLDAAGVAPGTEFVLIAPDVWEATYPGIVETTKAMYEDATGMTITIDVQPYTVILQRLEEGNYPGAIPAWTNPPSDLDPTTAWAQGLIPGGSTNLLFYDYQPVTDLVEQMQVTLDVDERQAMAHQVVRIGLGLGGDEHGLDGLFTGFGVMNGIQRVAAWPYVNASDDARTQFAHNFHRYDDAWVDVNHPEYAT